MSKTDNFAEPKFTGFSLKKKPAISFKKNTAFSKIEPDKENESENPNAHFDRKLTNAQIKKILVLISFIEKVTDIRE